MYSTVLVHLATGSLKFWHYMLLALFFITAGCSSSSSHDGELGEAAGTNRPAPDVASEDLSKAGSKLDQRPAAERPADRSELEAARAQLAAGQIDEAASKVRDHLLVHPGDIGGLFLAGEIEAARGRYRDAVKLLDEIPRDHPDAGLAALGQTADWLLAAEAWDEAEQRYKAILAQVPTANMAHRRLAYLMNREGRRQEACSHVRQLCRAGNVTQAELHTLIDECEAVHDEDRDSDSAISRFAPIGPVAEARVLFSRNEFKSALDRLRAPMKKGQLAPFGQAFFGRLATEVEDQEAITLWLENVGEEQEQFSDFWVALGTWMFRDGSDIEGATRVFCEAIVRNPTDWIAMTRLENCMDLLGESEQKIACRSRAILLRRMIRIHHRIVGKTSPQLSDIAELADLLDTLHRPLEAVMWRAIGLSYQTGPPQAMAELNAKRQELVAHVSAEMKPARALAGLELTRFPMPTAAIEKLKSRKLSMRQTDKMDRSNLGARPKMDQSEPIQPALPNVADSVGIEFQYHNASKPKLADTQLYEQFGGGVVAFDYDLSGRVDLFFNQGGNDPKMATRGKPNVFYRNLGSQFAVVQSAGVDDDGFGQGATSGDWNQDGFPDLVIANFGVNTLMINNGDGTFRPARTGSDWQSPLWTTCLAMADVTGDALPDLVEVNYVDDPTVHEVSPRGANGRFTQSRGPVSYRPAKDRVFIQRADGSMNAVTLTDGHRQSFCHGLGIVVTDIDGITGNEMFVANDTDANQLWFASEQSAPSGILWRDLARIRGCAYSARGGSGASMGIATADFDGNGMIDFHVTNFFNEPVHLYLQNQSHVFSDSAIKSDLYQPSLGVLGFGTQALDYDNNGTVDLAVVNGHIDDLQFKGSPHKMLPQLFAGQVDRFVLMNFDGSSNHWNRPAIGRGLLRFDWNRDGRMDLLATYHDVPAALLENHTESMHHWLQVRLVGTTSERDAIGARIIIDAGGREFVDVVTAGDGYACKNESIVAFGFGSTQRIDKFTVHWPNGTRQEFNAPALDQRILLVEGNEEIYVDF